MTKIPKGWQNTYGQVWLNVASGAYPLSHFVNLDSSMFLQLAPLAPLARKVMRKRHRRESLERFVSAREGQTLVHHDCRKQIKLPDSSVDHILCSHFLEHLYPDMAAALLADFRRLLRPGGTLHVIVPDLRQIVAEYLKAKDAREPAAADQLLRSAILAHEHAPRMAVSVRESIMGHGNQHRWMYDEDSLVRLLDVHGFAGLPHNDSPSKDWRRDNDRRQVNLLFKKG
ncbi:methyltransferase domain-containing protein [Actinacidiphila oryziradicis]|jgi:predicted SAM-dependent methyltransferase|uniref:methyltransferase domain-containing protein n=1 Tax=Actinacidiphila oryziradicis TaxID=2571141 RepID=UPI0023F06CC7|nr:methyltransferase domain-containing protein [Actinacidiphila oryziradicis]MCW2870904.1 Methyltransferase type 11 [Actinacidiphila oryziradicis]